MKKKRAWKTVADSPHFFGWMFDEPIRNGTGQFDVKGEGRQISVTNGSFEDQFDRYTVHIYLEG